MADAFVNIERQITEEVKYLLPNNNLLGFRALALMAGLKEIALHII